MGIVELASETWLVTGRHPVPIVTAAAFLAWQSLRPGPRLSCPLARFCRLAGVDLPPPAHLRLRELLEILLGMASQLSWLRGFTLDKKTVVKHIGDLLQHRVFLLKNAFSQQDGEEEQHDTAPGQDSMGQDTVGQGSPDKNSPDKDSLAKDSLGKDSPDKDSPGQDSPGQDSPGQGSPSSPRVAQKGCPSAGKRQRGGTLRPLLPPCLIHPRKRLRPAAPSAPDSAATGDEPISDSEIEQYLRSPEEIRAFRKAKAWP